MIPRLFIPVLSMVISGCSEHSPSEANSAEIRSAVERDKGRRHQVYRSVEDFAREQASGYFEHGGGHVKPRYFSAVADLNADGNDEILVYFVSPGHCGSGGCRLYILEPQRNRLRLLSEITISRPPIIVMPNTHHGWRSIAVRVAGGGETGHFSELVFDGRGYSTNPTIPPSRRLTHTRPVGDVAISDDDTPVIVPPPR
jgi:hypothetical protein